MNAPPFRRCDSAGHRLLVGRLPWLALVCLGLVGLSGCVYLRLLEFKNQLSDFDKFFSVNLENGLEITFLDPVILQKDMWKIGLPPTIEEVGTDGVTWIHVFEKQYGDARRDESSHDVRISLRFVDRKLAQFRVGDELFEFISKDAVLMTLRSLGKIEVNLRGRKASLDVEEGGADWDFPAPDKDAVVNTLGLAYSEEYNGELSTLVYRYKLLPSSPPSDAYKPEKHGRPYQFSIEFDSKDLISSITASFPFMGSIRVSY